VKTTLLLTAAVATMFAACNNANNNNPLPSTPPAAAEVPLSFELIKDSLKDKNLTVRVELLVAKGKGSEAINEAINKEACYILTMGDEKAEKLRNYKDMFAYLQKSFKESYPDGDLGGMMGWEFEFMMRKHHQSAGYLCLGFDSYSFAGGAHPNSYSGFVNIDLNSNKVLTNRELVDSVQVMPAVSAAFRNHWLKELPELKESITLESAGFFIEKNNLPLPNNIGINDKQATFYYNTYEVGAYVMGPTVLEIPLEKIAAGVKVK